MDPAISANALAKRYLIRRNANGKYGTDLADDLAGKLADLVRGRWRSKSGGQRHTSR